MITTGGLERGILIVACAISAGVHTALTPTHLAEGMGPGVGFAFAAVALALLVIGLTYRPTSLALVATTGIVLGSLLASYALATTTGLPVLHPDVEPIDGLAVATKAIEAVGLLAAGSLLWRGRPAVAVFQVTRKGLA